MDAFILPSVVAMILGQGLKVALKFSKGTETAKDLVASGSMPSVHTATVTALVMTALLRLGWDSYEFAIAAVLLLITTYDAMNARRAVGENRRALKILFEADKKTADSTDADEALEAFDSKGHTPAEVAVGAVIGVVVALIFNAFL